MIKFVITGAFFLIGIMIANAQHELVKKWETDTLLKVPESVLYDAAEKILYVANIDGDSWVKDGKGSIGKVGLDGKIIAVDWVSGLQAPKGMGLYQKKLYVADIDKVAVIDITTASIVATIPVEGAQGLNDVTVDKNGIVYVSDSKNKKVHRIENNQATTLLDNLRGPNGLLTKGKDLYLLDAGSLYKVEKNKTLTKLAAGMEGGTDGVEQVTGKEYVVSCWRGAIWYVNADGSIQKLLDSREQEKYTADIAYDAKNRMLYVPSLSKTIVAYELK